MIDSAGTQGTSTVSGIDQNSQEYKWISDADGNILEPADKYFKYTEVEFEYPWEAAALKIEDYLYFQIRIDFTGKVVEAVLMNPTQSGDLNERIQETVENSFFDETRIPAELYDGWFYYKVFVSPPGDMRQ